MSAASHYIAVDLGAESGRVTLAGLAGGRMALTEVRRFANTPIKVGDSLKWDFERLMEEIGAGLREALALEPAVASIGIDTWGVDYGLIDADGKLLEMPCHYRDARTQGVMARAFETFPREAIYDCTGIQFLPFNTLYQLIACRDCQPALLERAAHLLFMPSLIMHRLTGRACLEYTMASTTQMLDMRTGGWSPEIMGRFGLPTAILPELVSPGTCVGGLTAEWRDRLGCGAIPVVAVGTHDTASAVAAVPATGGRPWAFLSSGTWSLMGIEAPSPVITPDTCRWNFTNEGGVGGTIRLLSNIMGLWVLQECRCAWTAAGHDFTYDQLMAMAREAEPFAAVLDVDDERFLPPGDMPGRIGEYLERTGQRRLSEPGAIARAILEGLALRYDTVLRQLQSLAPAPIEVLHIVGGGIRNTLLSQLTADASGLPVLAGPAEATLAGNVLVQALAAGAIGSIAEGRKVVADSFGVERYEPAAGAGWDDFRARAGRIMTASVS